MTQSPVVIIPNLNGGPDLLKAIDSLVKQSLGCHIVVVDNASTDGSAHAVRKQYPEVDIIWHKKNLGYSGGVNAGFRRAMALGAKYTAPFNDDAVADRNWLNNLVVFMDSHDQYGAACAKIMKSDGKSIDSTGDFFTSWGLSYPRGRNQQDKGQYDRERDIFSASGAASLYRIEALRKVGLFDEDFFAYYEDIDLSFRMQLSGWKICFIPNSVVYHKVGMTSGRTRGFTTFQAIKNQPLLLWKNVPTALMPIILPRFTLAYLAFVASAIQRGQYKPVLKGLALATLLLPKKLIERYHIQHSRTVSVAYIRSILVWDLPPNASKLRALRNKWWRLRGKKR